MKQKTAGNILEILGFAGALLISVRLITFMFSEEYGVDSGNYSLLGWGLLWLVPLFFMVAGRNGFLIKKNNINKIYFVLTSLLGTLSLPMFYYIYPFGPYIYSIEKNIYVAVGVLIFVMPPLLLNTKKHKPTN